MHRRLVPGMLKFLGLRKGEFAPWRDGGWGTGGGCPDLLCNIHIYILYTYISVCPFVVPAWRLLFAVVGDWFLRTGI